MKKILYNLQLSTVNKEGKMLIQKDSNFWLWKNTTTAFHNYFYKEYEHHVIIPDNFLAEHLPINLFAARDVHYHMSRFTHTNSAYSGRYHWNVNEMKALIRSIKPDIIWENNPTLVNNWKTLLMEEKLIDEIPVITYNHWVDSLNYPKLDRRCPYSIRQAEGFLLADLTLCNSNFIKYQIHEQVKETFKDTFITHYKQKHKIESYIHVFPPMIDEFEFHKKPSKQDNIIRIMYNHRLSSLGYYKDSYTMFLQALNALKKEKLNNEVEVIITDVSGKIKNRSDIKFKDSKNIKIVLKGNMDRITYLDEMHKCDICVGLFPHNNGGGWSISLAEGILTKCAIIIPNHSGYFQMTPEDFSGKVYPHLNEVVEKLKILINNDKARIENANEAYNFYMKNYSSKKLITDLHKRLVKVMK